MKKEETNKQQCLIEGCLTGKVYSRGVCNIHYKMITNLVKEKKRTWQEFEKFGMAIIKSTRGTFKKNLFDKMLAKVSKK